MESISLAHSLSEKPLGPSPIIPTSLEGGKVSDRLGKLKSSSESWKNRVEQSDASKFTVAGRLQKKSGPVELLVARRPSDEPRRCPMLVVRSANQPQLGLAKSPSMMVPAANASSAGGGLLQRSLSVNDDATSQPAEEDGGDVETKPDVEPSRPGAKEHQAGRRIVVPRMDDSDTFEKFFVHVDPKSTPAEASDIDVADFDALRPTTERLVTKRGIQGPKGRRAARNPLKALAAREDISSEYTETKTGVAEREMRRMQMESNGQNKRSHLAAEAIAGLASVEDFKSVALKSSALPLNQMWLPYKPVMLLHVKGRSHIQTRLVEPVYTSVNRGDCFILVAGSQLFRYVGSFANVIEIARSKKICAYILENKDLGCTANTEVVLQDGKSGVQERQWAKFWEILGKPSAYEVPPCGHADEDELFEASLIESNKIYEFQDDSLVPLDKWWGCVPRFDMLDSRKVLIFDFGAELYVWNGKNASANAKRAAIKLAQEHYDDQAIDYTQCYLNPINFSGLAGHREAPATRGYKDKRGDWCILGKITQNIETVLFKEKFADWPEVERGDLEKDYLANGIQAIRALDGEALNRGEPYEEPNLVLENANLGRGNFYYDLDTMRHFDVITVSTDKWRINEANFDETAAALHGQFYSAESYIVRWIYQISVTVRELSGKVSNRATVGRERCVYFCWQGNDASANEKGSAALLTVELDKEKGSQMRVAQGDECPAFVRLFKVMVQHRGHRDECLERRSGWRLFHVFGNLPEECVAKEVECAASQLRSRASLLFVHGAEGRIVVWHGCRSAQHSRDIAEKAARSLLEAKAEDLFSTSTGGDSVETCSEGEEPEDIATALGVPAVDAASYGSLLERSGKEFSYTPRLFHFSSTQGVFQAAEVIDAFRHKELPSAYPFAQAQLYNARQPTIFLFDDNDMLWLWMGWWPVDDLKLSHSPTSDERSSPSNDNRAGVNRWISERRAALETAVSYWRAKHGDDNEAPFHGIQGYVVWAGLEPLAFRTLFPSWQQRDDVREINQLDGRTDELVPIHSVLQQLSQTEYPLEVLKERPLPEGIDPTRLELYLSAEDFVKALNMTREDFEQLPLWKQTNVKKENGLF